MSKMAKNMGIVKEKYKLYPEQSRRKSSVRKKKKDKRSFEEQYYTCPFCDAFNAPEPGYENEKFSFNVKRLNFCLKCPGEKVKHCPCCHRETWFNPDTNIYKHEKRMNYCGFVGERLISGSRDERSRNEMHISTD